MGAHPRGGIGTAAGRSGLSLPPDGFTAALEGFLAIEIFGAGLFCGASLTGAVYVRRHRARARRRGEHGAGTGRRCRSLTRFDTTPPQFPKGLP